MAASAASRRVLCVEDEALTVSYLRFFPFDFTVVGQRIDAAS